jgi:superfamily II DNA or RNA helicase
MPATSLQSPILTNPLVKGKYGEECRSPIVLRDYQLESCNKILESWKQYDRTLLVLPTAAGKTIVFSSIAATRLAIGRVLILARDFVEMPQ